MKLIPFQFEHLDLFAWRDLDYAVYNEGSELVEALRKAEIEDSFTLVHDGRIMGVGGVIPRSKKTAYCFTIFSRYAGPEVGRTVKRQIKQIMDTRGYHRLVTYCPIEADDQHKWCEWLGFELEGKCPMFDDKGNDYFQYGMVKHGT